jgi:hypothetical protein
MSRVEPYFSRFAGIGLALLSLLLGGCGASEPPVRVRSESNDPDIQGAIILPDSIFVAGQELPLQVSLSAPVQKDASFLRVSGRFGDWFFYPAFDSDSPLVALPPVLTQRRGELLLQLWQGQVLLDQQKVRILAGRAAGVIETYAGPRTIEALSGQKSMVVAVPKDRFGNPLPDGQSLQFHFRYPATGPETEEKPVENLIGVHPFEARSLAGKITMGVEADEARAEAEELRITPAWANRIRIRVEEWFPYADGRQNVKILTEKLRDPAGNLVSDGTRVEFWVRDSQENTALYRSQVSGGTAQVQLANPDQATTWEIRAYLGRETESNPLKLAFEPYVRELPWAFAASQRVLSVGPAIGVLKEIVPDGLILRLKINGPEQDWATQALLVDGRAEITLPRDSPAGWYRCWLRAGGKEETFELKLE